MPTYNVEVRFRGLCPFVPGADLDKGEKPEWVGSFLVNGSSRRRLEQVDAADLPLHLAYLRFKTSDLLGNEKGPDEMVLLRLDFVDVVFVPSAGTKRDLTVNYAKPADLGETPATDEQKRLFNWVTRMSDVMPGSGEVHRDCLATHPRSSRIVARIHIDHGRLEAGDLGRIGEHMVVSQLGAGFRRQATAGNVLLTMPCEIGSPFRIKIHGFRDPRDPKVHELVFKDPGAGKSLELEIVNLCVDDLLFQRGASLERAFSPDHDFRLNYLLSSEVTSLAGLPVPVALLPSPEDMEEIKEIMKKGAGGGPENIQCKPPMTKSASLDAVKRMRRTATRTQQG